MNKHIFIVNGGACNGKTTFEDMVLSQIDGEKYSIIDPVKELMIKNYLWNGFEKSPELRKALSDIKIALDEYCDFSFATVVSKVYDFNKSQKSLMFIDMREKEDIERAVKEFGAVTIYVKNNNTKIKPNNIADKFAESEHNYPYDIIIDNSNTLNELETIAKHFVDTIKEYDNEK